jgi:hypothetical protein
VIPIIEAQAPAGPAPPSSAPAAPVAEAGVAQSETFGALIALLGGGSPPQPLTEQGPDRSPEAPERVAEAEGLEAAPRTPALAPLEVTLPAVATAPLAAAPPVVANASIEVAPPVVANAPFAGASGAATLAPRGASGAATLPARGLSPQTPPPLAAPPPAAAPPSIEVVPAAAPLPPPAAAAPFAEVTSETAPTADAAEAGAPATELPSREASSPAARPADRPPLPSSAAERAVEARAAAALPHRGEPPRAARAEPAAPPAPPAPAVPAARRPEHARANEVEPAAARLQPELAAGIARAVDGAAAAQAADEPVDVREAGLAARLADSVELAATRGPRELRVQLRPPELGQLTVRVVETEGGLRVAIEATRGDVEELLLQQLPALRAALEGRELRIERIEVRFDELGDAGLPEREEPRGGRDRDPEHTPAGEPRDGTAAEAAEPQIAVPSVVPPDAHERRVDVRI